MNQITTGRRVASIVTFALVFAVLAAACGEDGSTAAESNSTTAAPTSAVSTTAAPTSAVSIAAAPTTAIVVEQDEALEQRRVDRVEAVATYTTFYGIEPTVDEYGCLESDEAMAVELDDVDEENLPLVLMAMCMPDKMAGVTDALIAESGLDEVDQTDLGCFFDQSAVIISDMNLQERLASAAADEPTPEQLEQINSECGWEPGRFNEVAMLLQ